MRDNGRARAAHAIMTQAQIDEVAESLAVRSAVPVDLAKKLARRYFGRYEGRRGSMVVDVVASAWRNYDRVEKHIVPMWERSVRTPSLKALSASSPKITGLRRGEAAAMQAVAAGLLQFAANRKPALRGDDEKIVKAWAKYAERYRLDTKQEPYVGAVKGIGTALYAYLRMRAGGDAIKADVWVARVLMEHGARFKKATDVVEVTVVAEAVAKSLGVSRLVLDQMLWRGEWKITNKVLDDLAKTPEWRRFARGYRRDLGSNRLITPTEVYGPKGMLNNAWGVSFKHPGDLWEVLAENMGGGMPPEVPRKLVKLCGPRVES